MRVLIDTNILISAALNPQGSAAKAYFKATESPYEPVLCDYCIDEFKRVIRNKLPKLIKEADSFLAVVLLTAQIISTPPDSQKVAEEALIRDINDMPIIRAAVLDKVDIILTGDKDFLESGIKNPRIVAPAEFLTLEK
jgi:putative PIN family toxin of toxin-antitoxin system